MLPALTRTMVILAAILDLMIPIEIYMTFDCFNGSAMVKKTYLYVLIFLLYVHF